VSIESSVASYYKITLDRKSSYANKILEKSWACLAVLEVVHGTKPVDELMNEFIKKLGLQIPILNVEVSKNILINVIVDCFAESNIMKDISFGLEDTPLGALSLRIHADYRTYINNLISSEQLSRKESYIKNANDLPVLLAAKSVRKEFANLVDTLSHMDSTGTDWSYQLRTFALPRSDKSLLEKGDYVMSKASRTFADKLQYQLRVLEQFPQLLD
jgi:hypothetical protein